MGDRIYVVGGWCDKYENDKTVEMYDPDKNEWTEVSRDLFQLVTLFVGARWMKMCSIHTITFCVG